MAWYQLRSERIRDVLRATASSGPGAGSFSSDESPAGGTPALILRDDPMLGPVVPGLWEVEVQAPEDVEQLAQCVYPGANG